MTETSKEAPAERVGTDTVRIERWLPGTVERVWAWLTERDKRAQWLADGAVTPAVGGEVALAFAHDALSHERSPERYRQQAGQPHLGRVTRYEPPHLLSHTWPEQHGVVSEVCFELAAQGDGVLLVVTHRRLPDRATMIDVASGWHAHLGLLCDHLNGRTPRGFWTAHDAAERDYTRRFIGTGPVSEDGDCASQDASGVSSARGPS